MSTVPGDGDQVDDLAEGGYLRHDYNAGGILPVSLGLVVNDTGQPERIVTAAELAEKTAEVDAAAKTPLPVADVEPTAYGCLCACHRCCVPYGEPCGDPGCCDGQQ